MANRSRRAVSPALASVSDVELNDGVLMGVVA